MLHSTIKELFDGIDNHTVMCFIKESHFYNQL